MRYRFFIAVNSCVSKAFFVGENSYSDRLRQQKWALGYIWHLAD